MMRAEAFKFLVSSTKFLVEVTECLVSTTRFGSADQKLGRASPHHFLVGLTKNEGQSNQNFTSTQPNYYLVVPTLTMAYKISISVIHGAYWRLQQFWKYFYSRYISKLKHKILSILHAYTLRSALWNSINFLSTFLNFTWR